MCKGATDVNLFHFFADNIVAAPLLPLSIGFLHNHKVVLIEVIAEDQVGVDGFVPQRHP